MIVIMLIYTLSLGLQFPSCVTIYNQCSNIKLAPPVYFSNGAVYSKLSSQQLDIGASMRVSFEINPTQYNFEGALLFKLKRYSDSQSNMDTSTTETDKNESTHVHILVAWKMRDSKPSAHVVLVKHTKEFAWNEDKLKKLYYENHDRLKEYDDTISATWLMDNNITLKAGFSIRDSDEGVDLNVSVSEEERDDYIMRPLCVDLKR
jgi:hypothetical protein